MSELFAFDLNLIGFLNDKQSTSRHTSSFEECLHDECTIKLFKTNVCDVYAMNDYQKALIRDGIDLKNKNILEQKIRQGLALSGVTIYTDSFWHYGGIYNAWKEYFSIPNKSTLRYAYVVAEYTKIPYDEVSLYNNYFDALIVPDQWLESVYYSSGVRIPIFTLPLALDLGTLLERPLKKGLPSEFIFGFSGVDEHRKNVKLLIKAFAKEFKNKPYVSLVIHSRFNNTLPKVQKMIQKSKCQNIRLVIKTYDRSEYEEFLSTLSCYVILSKGEGFSITPREALAAGIPCIISNNTAHKTICQTGYVAAVKSDIAEPAYTKAIGKYRGCMFNCSVKDTQKALRDVYQYYDYYLQQAQKGREWVKQYLVESIKTKYKMLIKSKKVILGKENKITEDCVMTNSPEFLYKYQLLAAL